MPKRSVARTETVDRPPFSLPEGVLLGAHMSIAGGTWKAPERGRALGCAAVQLFVKNNNRWVGKPFVPDEGERFRVAVGEAGNPVCFAHSSYLPNLAAPDPEVYAKSIEGLVDELERCAILGLPGVVVHPGSCGELSEDEGLRRVAAALDTLFTRTDGSDVGIWLETTAGQGRSLGWRFEHLAAILDATRHPDRLGFCLDTCHIFAAGYDLRTLETYEATLNGFDSTVGFDRLRAIHLNDCKSAFGSRVDRHHHIGQGTIGKEALGWILSDPRFAAIPKVLETPKGDNGEKDWDNFEVLLSCSGAK